MHVPAAPELGMVLSYAFLWGRENDRGETSGRKDRPAAIVIIRSDLGPADLVYVVPITHSQPVEGDTSKILIPRQIKDRLGLDEERSWVDLTEYNAFVWPGEHLRPTKQTRHASASEQTCLYGYLPRRFFAQLRQGLHNYQRSKKPRIVRR